MTAALLTSLALALTFTPALSLVLLKPKKAGEERSVHSHEETGPIMRKVLLAHERILNWALTRPLAMATICLVLVIGGYFAYRGLGSDLLPEMDEGAFILDSYTPPGTSLTESARIIGNVEKILHDTPEVDITSPPAPVFNLDSQRSQSQTSATSP